jgi:hypothetical protein
MTDILESEEPETWEAVAKSEGPRSKFHVADMKREMERSEGAGSILGFIARPAD